MTSTNSTLSVTQLLLLGHSEDTRVLELHERLDQVASDRNNFRLVLHLAAICFVHTSTHSSHRKHLPCELLSLFQIPNISLTQIFDRPCMHHTLSGMLAVPLLSGILAVPLLSGMLAVPLLSGMLAVPLVSDHTLRSNFRDWHPFLCTTAGYCVPRRKKAHL